MSETNTSANEKKQNSKSRTWRHKESKKIVEVLPWWEVLEPIADQDFLPMGKTNYKFGMLVQVGWLLRNEHGVWLGVGSSAAEHFEDITPAEPTNSTVASVELKQTSSPEESQP